MSALGAISVDLDTLPHYCRIQGLGEAALDDRARTLVEDVAMPRLLELYDGAPGTFFAIGEDAARPEMAAALRKSHAAGIEIASHSHAHDYAISRRAPLDIAGDLRRAHDVLGEVVGSAPVGFRAPGYTLSPALLQAVAGLGYRYDSSTFPAVPYWAAKAGVMGALRLFGKPSRAVLDTPKVLLAPRVPYRPSLAAPYARGDAPFIELPMAVAPVARLPFIGTFITAMPWPLVVGTYLACAGDRFFNLELHAIDVLDVSDGIPPALAARQHDARISAKEKMRRLGEVFTWLRRDGELMSLATAAERLAPTV